MIIDAFPFFNEVQLLIVRYKINLVPLLHYQDTLHIINISSMIVYANILFSIISKTT